MTFAHTKTAFVALMLGTGSLLAQTAEAPNTTVQAKTYEQDGRKITERTLTTVVRETAPKPSATTVAIFVANRAGKIGDTELGALEDYITGRVTDLNVQVISGETALAAIAGMEPGTKTTALDAQLAQGTSAVRLAQTLGATYLMQVTLTGFDSNKKTIDAYGVKTVNDECTARVTYKILDGVTGASLAADTVRVTKMVQNTPEMADERSGVLNSLLEEAAGKVAISLKRQIDRGHLASTSATQGTVTFTLTTELADIYIPDVRIGAENTLSISDSKFKVSALAATVEIDGIAVGTAPGQIQAKAGLHKLRVVREGFKPWERTVNLSNGQKLNVALEMSEAGYARWQDATKFINELKNGARLTDGEVKRLEGEAKMLEQSGFKVDTKEGIQITNKSIF
jgi:hypothetical protein